MQSPQLYATFLLWLLAELFEHLPEIGDPEKPKLVFFFDEAHLLFTDAPKALLDKIEQVVRLIRSKGVGVFFVTQNPLDIPDTVLGQLGNRVQHALRAFTPRDQKAVKTAAQRLRANPGSTPSRRSASSPSAKRSSRFWTKRDVRPRSSAHSYCRRPRASGPSPRMNARPSSTSRCSRILRKTVDRESAYESLGSRAGTSAPPAATPLKPMAESSIRSKTRWAA